MKMPNSSKVWSNNNQADWFFCRADAGAPVADLAFAFDFLAFALALRAFFAMLVPCEALDEPCADSRSVLQKRKLAAMPILNCHAKLAKFSRGL